MAVRKVFVDFLSATDAPETLDRLDASRQAPPTVRQPLLTWVQPKQLSQGGCNEIPLHVSRSGLFVCSRRLRGLSDGGCRRRCPFFRVSLARGNRRGSTRF